MTELRRCLGKLRLRPLPGQQVFTIDALRLLVDQPRDLLAIWLPFQLLLTRPAPDAFIVA